jgi:hypothetical protein
MRERGARTGLAAGAGAGSATAAESAAACICGELRRQYAIESLPSWRDEPARSSSLIYPRVPAREAESELNLLKISRFLTLEGRIQPIFGAGCLQYC